MAVGNVELDAPTSFEEALRATEISLETRTSSSGLDRGVLERSSILQKRAATSLREKKAQIRTLLNRVAPDLPGGVHDVTGGRFMGALSLYAQGLAQDRGHLARWGRETSTAELHLPIEVESAFTVAALVFHPLQGHHSLMGVMGFSFDGHTGFSGDPMIPQGPVAEEFVFLEDEDSDALMARFDAWLEPFLVAVVDYWRKKLASA